MITVYEIERTPHASIFGFRFKDAAESREEAILFIGSICPGAQVNDAYFRFSGVIEVAVPVPHRPPAFLGYLRATGMGLMLAALIMWTMDSAAQRG